MHAALTAEAPWGDYGRILVHGMSAHLGRVNGRIQLERTGPFVPGITVPGVGDVVVTNAVRHAIEADCLTGCTFAPVDKARIVSVPWTEWDPRAELPAAMPKSKEPEDLVLAVRHDQSVSDRIGELWELVPDDFGEATRTASPLGRLHYRFLVSAMGGRPPDFFRARNMRYLFLSARARSTIGDDALRWCRLHPVEVR